MDHKKSKVLRNELRSAQSCGGALQRLGVSRRCVWDALVRLLEEMGTVQLRSLKTGRQECCGMYWDERWPFRVYSLHWNTTPQHIVRAAGYILYVIWPRLKYSFIIHFNHRDKQSDINKLYVNFFFSLTIKEKPHLTLKIWNNIPSCHSKFVCMTSLSFMEHLFWKMSVLFFHTVNVSGVHFSHNSELLSHNSEFFSKFRIMRYKVSSEMKQFWEKLQVYYNNWQKKNVRIVCF